MKQSKLSRKRHKGRSRPAGTSGEHLLIDGFNVIHAWPELRKALEQGSDVAQQRLADCVRVVHDFDGVRMTIVFDGRGDDIDIERPIGDLTFSHVYAPAGSSADALIEQYVFGANKPDKITVVTRDNMISETVRTLGARVITPDDLQDRVKRCEQMQANSLERHRKETEREWRRRMKDEG